ncbi:MAG TPA: hypothetical protein IAD08_08215 [Candidatus Scatovivens faecipullorum]|nr:hypothetical protein [Candidatus Scatovivens faecipullorum]
MKSLTKVILKNSIRTNPSKKSLILGGIAFSIVFLFLSIMMILFSYIVTKQLIKINQAYAFVNILLLMNFFILFAKSVFESLNVLYFSKDLKILLRIPIYPKDILHAKFFNMIISEYQMEVIMLGIPMIVYGILTKVNFLFYIYMFLVLLILPIIPILLTSLVIAIIMRFTNFIKNKNKVLYITMIISMFLMGFVTMIFSNNQTISVSGFRNIILKTNGLAESIADYFILIKPIMNTLLNYDNIDGLKNLILYYLESIICYFIIIFIISKIYLKGAIGTTINSDKNTKCEFKELNLKDFESKKISKTYIIKEWKTLLRTPIFCIECVIMPLLYPICILAIVLFLMQFAKLVGLDLIESFKNIVNSSLGISIFLIVGQVFYMLNFSSIIAISRDSNNAILIKFLPIDLYKQFKIKIRIGILINTLASLIVSIAFLIFTKKLLFTFIIFLSLCFINVIGEKCKLLIDLQNPQMNWNSEYTMMKQNTNIMYELFYTFFISGCIFVISKIIIRSSIFLFTIFVITFLINFILSKYIDKKKAKLFKKIY